MQPAWGDNTVSFRRHQVFDVGFDVGRKDVFVLCLLVSQRPLQIILSKNWPRR